MRNKIISLLLSLTILKPCGVNNLNEVKINTNEYKYTCETSLDTEEKLNNYIINWSKQEKILILNMMTLTPYLLMVYFLKKKRH